MKLLKLTFFTMGVLLMLLACAGLGGGAETPEAQQNLPQVTLTVPEAGQTVPVNEEIRIESSSVDADQGIVRVELLVDNEVIWVDANPDPQPNNPYIVAQPWTPQTPGSHVIQVRAYDVDNAMGQSEPRVIEVGGSAQSVDEESTPNSTLTPTPAPLQDTTPANTPETAATGESVTATLAPVCTPPPCRLDDGEVYYCPDECPGGCGTTCATVTPLPTITPTPTATPTPGDFEPTGLEPEGRFKDIWLAVGGGESRLGYPTGPEIIDRNFARQYFDRGVMFWWDNPGEGNDYIWVIDSPAEDLKSGDSWNRYPDTWQEGDEFSCDAARANGNFGPIRGFGKVWCEHPELQTRLGNPRDYEGGSGGNPPFAHVQFFQGGVMIYNPLNVEVFVLFDQGDWLRFLY